MTGGSLALVVGDIGAGDVVAAQTLAAAAAQLRPDDGWAWASDRPPPEAPRPLAWARCRADASRGELYGAGLAWAVTTGHDVVAFTDAATRLEADWRRALGDAVAGGAVAVGGPVVPGDGNRTAAGWAGFLTEYAPHAVAPFLSESGDLSGNNVAYRIDVVRQTAGGPFWKSVVDGDLRRDGHRLELATGMVVTSLRSFSLRDVTVARSASGRLHGTQAASGQPRFRRTVRALACVALPAVRIGRLVAVARRDERLTRALARSAPLVAAGEAAWSIGEAIGRLFPGHPPKGVR